MFNLGDADRNKALFSLRVPDGDNYIQWSWNGYDTLVRIREEGRGCFFALSFGCICQVKLAPETIHQPVGHSNIVSYDAWSVIGVFIKEVEVIFGI